MVVENDGVADSQSVFVPPKHNTSTPDFQVISAGEQFNKAQASGKRARHPCHASATPASEILINIDGA
jgi:hypothetical protein